MDPITISVISGVLFYAIDKRRKRAEESKASSLDSFTLPVIGAAEVEMFTHVTGPEKTRQFDRVASDGLPTFLAARSVVPISTGPVGRVSPNARVYRVVPLTQGLSSAADAISAARAEGQIVLASLSLIGVSWGSEDPMLIVVGGEELKTLVASPPGVRGDFALLPPRVERVVIEPPVPAVDKDAKTEPSNEEVPAVEVPAVVEAKPDAPPKPKQKPNGVPREPVPAVVTTTGEVVKE